MSAPDSDETAKRGSTFGRLLRFWRTAFRESQEALALDLASSTRHISRLENGLVQPSKAMVAKISGHFGLGERDHNQLMFAAGYAADVEPTDFWGSDLRWLRKSMAQVIGAFEPNPAVLCGAEARFLMFNRAWLGLMRERMPADRPLTTLVYYDHLFSSSGASGVLKGWPDIQAGILMSLQQEAILREDDSIQCIVDHLTATYETPVDWAQRAVGVEPMVSYPAVIEVAKRPVRFTSVNMVVSQRGPTTYASEPRLKIILLLPPDTGFDPASLIDPGLDHPLLHLHYLAGQSSAQPVM